MRIETVELSKIKKSDIFFFAVSSKISECEFLLRDFPYNNFVLLNEKYEIVYGYEFIEYYTDEGQNNIDVIIDDKSIKEFLRLAYKYKDRFFGLNDFEKLVFIKKSKKYFTIAELYKNFNIGFSLNDELLDNINIIISDEFKEVLIDGKINLSNALQICKWEKKDREDIIGLFTEISFSKSQQINIIEMIEEILFRDKTNVKDIFDNLGIVSLISKEKPQKNIVDKIFGHRYPLYKKEVENWDKRVKKLNLPYNMKLSHYPFFEKDDVELRIFLNGIEEIKKLKF